MTSLLARVTAVATALVLAATAFAHHGVSTYRMDVTLTLEGLVESWDFGNPHTRLKLRVEDSVWEIEGAPPRWMTGQGFAPESFRVGDPVTIELHPHRNQAQAGILMEVRRTDGTVLKVNRPASLGGP